MSSDDETTDDPSDDFVELPGHIEVFSDVIANADVVGSSSFALLVGVGRTGAADSVLVPMLEWSLEVDVGGAGNEATPVVRIIPFENAAYLVRELASDLAGITSQLHAMSSGGLSPASARIEAADRFLADAEQDLRACRDALSRMADVPSPSGTG